MSQKEPRPEQKAVASEASCLDSRSEPLMPRKTGARAFRSMDLNARRRLGVRQQRHGVDQQVLVDIMSLLSLVI